MSMFTKRLAMTTAAVLIAVAGLAAQEAASAATDPAGRWALSVQSPHGAIEMTLELQVDGTKLTGTLRSSHTGDRAVAGEIAGRRITLQTTGGDPDEQFGVTATLAGDALDGYLSTAIGDVTFSGRRVKG
jgi:hypothetical protein